MKTIILALAALTFSAFAQSTPEEVAQTQLTAMRDADWKKYTQTMHPAAMVRFHELMVKAAEAATASENPQAKSAMERVFGGMSAAKIKSTKPEAFFEMFMKNFTAGNPAILDGYRKSEVKFLGHVVAGETAWVVSNITRSIGENTVKTGGAAAFEKDGAKWKAALSGELEVLAAGMIVQFSKK